jgi:SPP1 gp7 family putative phage head morphogenesis protein
MHHNNALAEQHYNPAYTKAFIEYLRYGTAIITTPYYLVITKSLTERYIWRTQEDGRVRPSHAANNGKIFEWDNPPPTGHPGQAYGCRCWAERVAPDKAVQEQFDPGQEGNYDRIMRDERFGKLYRDAINNKIWYSKERSGDRAHSGEHWKQFIETDGILYHKADIDMTGKIMNKHKSKVGSRIDMKDLIGVK